MDTSPGAEVAVIGAGVVGMCIALRLAQEGRDVVLIDPAPPGSGASYGNAGTIADYAVMPVGTPDVLRNLPSLLFDRNSPLSIRRAALPALAPWLLRFARQSLPGATRRNALAIAALTASATADWRDLAASIGGTALMQQRGCLYVYETAAAYRAAAADMAQRRAFGVRVDLMGAAELAALEPGLPPAAGAAFFGDAVFLNDPGQMMAHLAAAVQAAGVRLITGRVLTLRRGDGVTLRGDGVALRARHVVIAAGAQSRNLAAQAGDRVPLDTERGYHVEWDMPVLPVTRPTCPTARGFYLCPMAGRLRVAGTVELGGLHAPPSPHRVARLIDGARAILPHLGTPSREWMGFRPSMPDSRPVIGASRGGHDVLHAYGHGHIGVTLAPVTARIIADVIAGRVAEVPLAPYAVTRFD